MPPPRCPRAVFQERFPQVWMQPKGLLATEAPVTLPLLAPPGWVPLLDEVFLEFEAEGGRFHALAPAQARDGRAHYVLLADRAAAPTGALKERLDALLREALRYRAARAFGQLGPAQVRLSVEWETRYLAWTGARGGPAGVAKLRALLPQDAAAALLEDGP